MPPTARKGRTGEPQDFSAESIIIALGFVLFVILCLIGG